MTLLLKLSKECLNYVKTIFKSLDILLDMLSHKFMQCIEWYRSHILIMTKTVGIIALRN